MADTAKIPQTIPELLKIINNKLNSGDLTKTKLVSIIGEATASSVGLMSATDKANLNTLITILGGSGEDSDTIINTLKELLKIFETYPEGTDIFTLINSKIDKATADTLYLSKTTYEWNKEIAFGSTGKLCIGSFPMYDSGVTVEIKAVSSTTYYGVLVLRTQNVKSTQTGSYTVTVYGDASNTIAPNIYIERLDGTNIFTIYFNPQQWSKNLIHIQAVALNTNTANGTIAPDGVTNICTSVSEIPSTATIKPINALTSNFASPTGSYSGMTVGKATNSTNATNDQNGLNIASNYALKNEIPTIPSSLKNPYSLTISDGNSSTTDLTYDGSQALTISKANIGLGNVPNVDTSNATNISNGTLPDERISSNIARVSQIPTIDSTLSSTSTNALQNKIIYTELNKRALASDLSKYALSSSLSNYATLNDIPNVPSWALASSKPSYSYTELSDKPTIPTKTSQLTNDSGYITGSYLPLSGGTLNADATIKLSTYGTRFLTISGNSIVADMSNETGGWAGAFSSVKDPSGTTTTLLGWYGSASGLNHIFMGGTYSDPFLKFTSDGTFTFKITPYVGSTQVALKTDIPTVPTKTSQLTNDSGYITTSALSGYATNSSVDTKIDTAVNGLLGEGVEDAYNTFKEIQDLLKADDTQTANLIAQVNTNTSSISNLSKVATSGSYNDLSNKPTIPTKTSELTNDSKYVKSDYANMEIKSGGSVSSTSWLCAFVNQSLIQAIAPANLSVGAATKATNDSDGNAINTTYAKKSSLATVATSGSYDDLTDTPEGHFIRVESSGSTAGTWLGTSDEITEYYTGLTILYKIPIAGASPTTLNINSLGAKKCFRNNNSNLTTHYPAGSVIMLYYDATLDSNNGGWRSLADYDSTDVQQLRAYYARYYTGENPVYSYKLCGIDSQGRIQPLTLETGTGTSKTVNTVAIKPDKIFYYNATKTVAANTLFDHGTLYYAIGINTAAYTFNSSIAAYRDIYLKGTYSDSTGLFTLDNSSATSWYVQVPYNTSFTNSTYFATGYQYIYLGRSYSSANYMYLYTEHKMYAFDGTNLLEYNTKKFNDLSKTYLSSSGGAINGNLLLHADSGDSPKLIFERGDNTGTITDWNMYVSSGILKINTVSTSASTSEKTVVSINYNGDFDVTGRILENGTALSSKYGVLAGTNRWTGSNTFSGGTILNGSVSCNSNTNVRDGDYFKIADADAPANTFRFDVGANKLKKLSASTTTYEWTFPSKTGTLATTDDIPSVDLSGYGALASANTWTGSNTFNGKTFNANCGNNITDMGSINLSSWKINLTASSGLSISGDVEATSNKITAKTFLSGTSMFGTEITSQTIKQTHASASYTISPDTSITSGTYALKLPAKSGTLATTNDLSGYGALASVNNWTATNTFSSGIMVTSPNNTNYLAFLGNQVLVNGSGNLTFPTKSGTIATTDDIPTDNGGGKLYQHGIRLQYTHTNGSIYEFYLIFYRTTDQKITDLTNLSTVFVNGIMHSINGYNLDSLVNSSINDQITGFQVTSSAWGTIINLRLANGGSLTPSISALVQKSYTVIEV